MIVNLIILSLGLHQWKFNKDLYSDTHHSQLLRENMYKEKSN